MGFRRRSRELAMQALFDMDISHDDSSERFMRFCRNFAVDDEVFPFFEKLTKGVIEHRAEIDAHIKKYADNWKISRMSGVDRNIIRIAVYEMMHCPDIPAKVSINEAIDIGKKFGTGESGAFINGILDGIWISMKNDMQKDMP